MKHIDRQRLLDRMEARGAPQEEIMNQILRWQHEDRGETYTDIPLVPLTTENISKMAEKAMEQKEKEPTEKEAKDDGDVTLGDIII